jgi:hypothetical protein
MPYDVTDFLVENIKLKNLNLRTFVQMPLKSIHPSCNIRLVTKKPVKMRVTISYCCK